MGAESLLGRGDLLFTPPSSPGLIRLHAPFASEREIDTVVEYIKTQRPTQYDQSFLKESGESSSTNGSSLDDGDIDELFDEAKSIVLNDQKTSISYIQRRLQIGYNRAARIVEQLENMGVLSAPNAKGQREII
jgi:S-DNA-T family DNA segregation ATPase FtsK/SpoIIIE